MNIFAWFNDQFLKMKWLFNLIELLVERVFKLSLDTRIGESVHFFIYDVIKIFILLSIMIFIISYIQSYFPPARTRKIMGGIRGIRGNILGGLLGILTPFCSCSSIPIFIGFVASGMPLGATFSFLIASPMIDLAAFLLLVSSFGLKIGLTYVAFGLLIAIVGGLIIEKLKLDNYVEGFVYRTEVGNEEIESLDF